MRDHGQASDLRYHTKGKIQSSWRAWAAVGCLTNKSERTSGKEISSSSPGRRSSSHRPIRTKRFSPSVGGVTEKEPFTITTMGYLQATGDRRYPTGRMACAEFRDLHFGDWRRKAAKTLDGDYSGPCTRTRLRPAKATPRHGENSMCLGLHVQWKLGRVGLNSVRRCTSYLTYPESLHRQIVKSTFFSTCSALKIHVSRRAIRLPTHIKHSQSAISCPFSSRVRRTSTNHGMKP